MKSRLLTLLLLLTLLALPARTLNISSAQEEKDTRPWPTEEWATSTPEEQGMDSEILVDMLEYLQEEYPIVHSFLIVRNGYLVMEMYNHPNDADSLNVMSSALKSVVSTLIGIAIGDGMIAGVDEPMLAFFPDQTVANLDEDKSAMTIEHLLTMTAGMTVIQPVHTTRVQSILDISMRDAPGTRFAYNTGASHLLKAIIANVTGMSTDEFAEERLFEPLGISEFEWLVSQEGIPIELELTSRDMAKIGYLYLNKGEWDSEQILPADYVEQATISHAEDTPSWAMGWHYGYLWYVNPEDGSYTAVGSMTKWIAVFPELNIVVVTTGSGGSAEPQYIAFTQYVIPAAVSTDPLPENREALEALEAMIEAFAKP